MRDFLDTIKPIVEQRVREIHPSDTNFTLFDPEPPEIDFLSTFKNPGPAIIAEIKFASPSKGDIYHGNLGDNRGEGIQVAIAKSYLQNGASALSVLTEPFYFRGKIEYIRDIRHSITIREQYPNCNILMKDFILDERQIIQGKKFGANAVLLIAAFLTPDQLKHLYNFALKLKLTPFIEVHNEEELESVLSLNPKLIGVNNRDLTTLKIDLNTSRNLIKKIPKSIYAVCESGIETAEQIQEMFALGFKGFLIGSSLMRSNDPGIALKALLDPIKNEN